MIDDGSTLGIARIFFLPGGKDKEHYFQKHNKGSKFLDVLMLPKDKKSIVLKSIFKGKAADLGIYDDEYVRYHDLNVHQKEHIDNRVSEYVNHFSSQSKGSCNTSQLN